MNEKKVLTEDQELELVRESIKEILTECNDLQTLYIIKSLLAQNS